MECPVCYENNATKKLVCGHEFCGECVKTWYMSGKGTCPMCRRKLHYRRMPVNKWRDEADDSKKNNVFQESFEELLEGIMRPVTVSLKGGENIPDDEWFLSRYTPVKSDDGKSVTFHRKNVRVYELVDLEKTYRAIRDVCSVDELDCILKETDDYYSDRRVHLRNRVYSENGHVYPPLKRIDTKNIRNNARRG